MMRALAVQPSNYFVYSPTPQDTTGSRVGTWAQLQFYPDVSVWDNDPVTAAGDMDYSLRIVSGRIYHGCSLKLKQPPTSKRKAVYHCSIDNKSVELVATVPGIEVNFDSRTTYVLVDISPDHRVVSPCFEIFVGHVHPPVWRKSVVIVCEEVDTFGQLATYSSAILTYQYRLRRITTLEWDCSTGERGRGRQDDDQGRRGQDDDHWLRGSRGQDDYLWLRGRRRQDGYLWLPFKPSLEYIESLVCSAEGGNHGRHLPDVFCDPVAVAGLPTKTNPRHRSRVRAFDWDKCPKYEVYLV